MKLPLEYQSLETELKRRDRGHQFVSFLTSHRDTNPSLFDDSQKTAIYFQLWLKHKNKQKKNQNEL